MKYIIAKGTNHKPETKFSKFEIEFKIHNLKMKNNVNCVIRMSKETAEEITPGKIKKVILNIHDDDTVEIVPCATDDGYTISLSGDIRVIKWTPQSVDELNWFKNRVGAQKISEKNGKGHWLIKTKVNIN